MKNLDVSQRTSPLEGGQIAAMSALGSFSAGSFSPARWSVASFTKAAERESFRGFR